MCDIIKQYEGLFDTFGMGISEDEYGTVKTYGIDGYNIFIESVINDINNCVDRPHHKIQDYLDKNHKDLKLKFTYKELEIDLENLTIVDKQKNVIEN